MTIQDSGEYKCIVRSVVGEIWSATTLLVEGPPGPPGKLIIFLKLCADHLCIYFNVTISTFQVVCKLKL